MPASINRRTSTSQEAPFSTAQGVERNKRGASSCLPDASTIRSAPIFRATSTITCVAGPVLRMTICRARLRPIRRTNRPRRFRTSASRNVAGSTFSGGIGSLEASTGKCSMTCNNVSCARNPRVSAAARMAAASVIADRSVANSMWRYGGIAVTCFQMAAGFPSSSQNRTPPRFGNPYFIPCTSGRGPRGSSFPTDPNADIPVARSGCGRQRRSPLDRSS